MDRRHRIKLTAFLMVFSVNTIFLGCDSVVIDLDMDAVGDDDDDVTDLGDGDDSMDRDSGIALDAGPEPVAGPTCRITVKSIRGVLGPGNIAPLDDVVLTLEESEPGPTGDAIVSYEWTLEQKPMTSSVALTSANTLDTSFIFGTDIAGLDVAGNFVVSAVVTDAAGIQNQEPCGLTVQAIPPQSIYVQLTWDTSDSDLDLLLSRREPDGRFCVVDDLGTDAIGEFCANPGPQYQPCYYGNCRAYGAEPKSPDWDGDGVFLSDGDPSLDIDDFSGFGPENINIAAAEADEYLVGVGCFSSATPTQAVLRVYLEGAVVGVYTKMLVPGEFWEVGIIDTTKVVPCVDDLNTSADECP